MPHEEGWKVDGNLKEACSLRLVRVPRIALTLRESAGERTQHKTTDSPQINAGSLSNRGMAIVYLEGEQLDETIFTLFTVKVG